MDDSPEYPGAPGPLLATKLYIPKWRPGLVSRPRLIERLNQGAERKLTLISAPAGFGKTTLLAEWLTTAPAGERPAAWISLDQSDSDSTLFWTYFIAAAQTIHPGVGANALALLHSPQPSPVEAALTSLINEVNAIQDGVTLVLDDYHVIESQPIHQSLAFLLDHLPPQLRLIIASRSDPPLPLAGLRGRGEVAELRAADLRFTPEEAAAFLNNVMGLGLAARDAAALEMRTEGWIAGLQLAALSMQGRENVSSFVRSFAGDDRYIVDYLVEEVLQRQPERVRGFLLQTAILDRLTGLLCDAVTDQEGGSGMLEVLERGNLFVIPLDNKRQWYRYHHLFAAALQVHLKKEQPDRVPDLHRRASAWCERHGLSAEAIRHALAAGDFERAAMLVELAWSGMHRTYQDSRWRSWVETLPDELIRARPVLSVGHAWALLNAGELEHGEARLRDAERWLEPTDASSLGTEAPAAGVVVVDETEFRFLPATIAAARAFHAGALGDVSGAVRHGQRAVRLSPSDDHYARGRAVALLGLAYWASGDLDAAYRTFADGMATIRLVDRHQQLLTIAATAILAEIRVAQGRLHEAARTFGESIDLATGHGEPAPPATAILYAGLSEIHRERNELKAAAQLLQRGAELGERVVSRDPPWLVARSRLQATHGDYSGALGLLDEAERLHQREPVPDVRPIAALRVRLWIAQGRLAEARAWARERDLSVDDDLAYLHEFEHITLARVLIARYRSDRDDRSIHEATELLERLLKAAEAGERFGSVIEILIEQALAHEARGDIPAALALLERAVALAEPEGYVRIFVDEGEAMRDLLHRVAAQGAAGAYARRLLSAFSEPTRSVAFPAGTAGQVEPLTPREIEILRFIAAGMRNQEIADHLFISLATVKRHIANVYGKLGVSHRTEAVARANELHLI